MRNLKKFAALLLFVVVAASVNAQTLKFGHIDMQALIQVMPERTTAEAEFTKFQNDLGDVYDELNTEYQTKLNEFQYLGADVSEVRRNEKVKDIQTLEQRIRDYSQTAQTQMQQKESELMNPIYTKAQAAIEEVAKEQSLVYVFEANSLLYKSNQSVDILPLVKKKLGIE